MLQHEVPPVRHHAHLSPDRIDSLFLCPPQPVASDDERDTVALALGATLYVPATRDDLVGVVTRRAGQGVTSMVLDLEDAVADDDLARALDTVPDALAALGEARLPVRLFVRMRDAAGILELASRVRDARALDGFVLPKFGSRTGARLLSAVASASSTLGRPLYAMPVVESREFVHRETRDRELSDIAALLAAHREQVLAVRLGATDMCSPFGIRRDRDMTIYDVRVVADAIGDVVNYLGRRDGSGFVITGPVWEYFADHERMFRPLLRSTPFEDNDAVLFRRHLVGRDLDGLLREIALDRANGIHGKTVIHPTHVPVVHALSTVTHEEHADALDIAGSPTGGAQASCFRNKMNEARPHHDWAQLVLRRAQVFGVTRPGVSFVDVLTALGER